MARVNIFSEKVTLYTHQVTWPLVNRTVRQIHNGAVRLAPRGTHRSGSGVVKPGLPLKQSIGSRIDSQRDTITGVVGSRVDHAATAHQGSKAHFIRSRGKLLKFEWERGQFLLRAGRKRGRGRFFYFEKVHHPGNKRPVRFLTTPMHMFARANGFRTSSIPVSRTRLP